MDLAIPVFVTVIVAALFLVSWNHLVSQRRAQVRAMAELTASQSQQAVAGGVRDYAVALHNLVGFWATVGVRPVEEWRANAEAMLQSFPSLDYLVWVHPDGSRYRMAARNAVPPADDVAPVRGEGNDARMIGPDRDERGAIGFRLFLPVRSQRADLGELEARIDVHSLLAEVLQNWAPGYALSVHWGAEELFRRAEPARDPGLAWWTIESEVPLVLAATWNVAIAPTEELAAASLTPDPHYLLAVGIVLAVALGMLTHQLLVSFHRTRELTAGKQKLEANAGELLRLNEVLEARVADRTTELETLTRSFSHDLKSPLGAILNFSTILESDHRAQLGEEGADILARIHRSANRATALLDGLLRLDRARRANFEEQEIDMNALARKAFAHVQSCTPDRPIELVLEPLPHARGDQLLVTDALVNLFDNAAKFTHGREKPQVRMHGKQSGAECVYEVCDNGQGFEMQYVDKLFGVFERLHTSPDVPGTGVGLALVKKIVSRHGGRVWAEGEVNVGARFTFTLPAARALG